MKDIQENILKAIDILIQDRMKSLKFDYTFSAIIKTDNGSDNFTVTYNGQDYDINARAGLTLTAGDVVYVRCVQGDFSQKFIDCIRV